MERKIKPVTSSKREKAPREGLNGIWYDASKSLYLKRKVRKQIFNPPPYAKAFLYIFFFSVAGILYYLYSHQLAHNHHKLIHERKMAHRRIVREKYQNNKHMISKVKSQTQKLSEVDILKNEMKKLQEENEKLKRAKNQRDEL